MKSSVIEKCRNFYEIFAEKCMETIEYLWFKLKFRKGYKNNLLEKYSIRRKYINQEFVQQFLKERERIISNNRYRMAVVEDCEADEEEEIIGHVTLFSKNRFIQRATLITKARNDDSTRLVYWKFKE